MTLVVCCCRSGSSADELDDVPALPNQVPNFVSIFGSDHSHQHSLEQPASTSPPSRNKDIFKPRFPARGNSSVTTEGEIATDSISGKGLKIIESSITSQTRSIQRNGL
jgi:hypothetical protein